MKQRIISLIIALSLLWGLMPTVALPGFAAEDSGTWGDNLTWTMNMEEGILTISGQGDMMDASAEEYPWYSYRLSVRRVIISDGVTSIGANAFSHVLYLEAASLGKDITYIGDYGFSGCSRLRELNIPDSLTGMGEYAFESCKKLTYVDLPQGVTSISAGAFFESGLREINLRETVTSIDYAAFGGTADLKQLVLPPTVSEAVGIFADGLYGIEALVILNPRCDFGYGLELGKLLDRTVTIYGYENSSAQAYAEEAGHGFRKLCDCPEFGEACHIVTQAPTCALREDKEGKITYTCDVCSVELVIQTESGLEHNYQLRNEGAGHIQHCIACGYEEWQPHYFPSDDGWCRCGLEQPPVDREVKIYHSLDLVSDITVNYVVPEEQLADFDAGSIYLDVFHYNHGYEYYDRISPELRNGYYYFPLKGTTAIQMDDSFQAYLSGTKNGQLYRSNHDYYNVATYAYNKLSQETGDTEASRLLKTLCADLLRYGGAAQRFKEYYLDEEREVDRRMTEEEKSYLSDLSQVTFGNTYRVLEDVAEPEITWVGRTLDLNARVTLKFVFSMGRDPKGCHARVRYVDIYGQQQEVISWNLAPYSDEQNLYVFEFDGLLAAELRSVVSVQIYDGDTPVSLGDTPISPTVEYSADTYGGGKTGLLGDLCKALFAYSDSAKAYFLAAQ